MTEREAVNFLIDKVGEPHITSYIDHLSSHQYTHNTPHAIVPDIHNHNFLAGKQRANESGTTTAAEAVFEIKIYTSCNSCYKDNISRIKPPEQ